MSRKLIAVVAVLAATAGTVATIAAAGPAAARQEYLAVNVVDGKTTEPFTLTRTFANTRHDSGTAIFCCWTVGHVVRSGQSLDTGNPQMTLKGKLGTLVTRNQIVWMDLPKGAVVYTGTWKILRGTGAYAGLEGGGLAAGVMLANGKVNARFTGYVSPK